MLRIPSVPSIANHLSILFAELKAEFLGNSELGVESCLGSHDEKLWAMGYHRSSPVCLDFLNLLNLTNSPVANRFINSPF